MTDLDTLKQAMRAGERSFARNLDLVEIMARGRRLRTRRRLGYGATGVLSAAVLAVTAVTMLGNPAVPSVLPATTTGLPRPVRTTEARPTVAPSDLATAPPVKTAVGEVVKTGRFVGGEARVLFFSAVDVPSAPDVRIGLNIGWFGADGRLRADIIVNDVRGSDRSRGFHQIGYDQSNGPLAYMAPTFGYFVGPAVKIVGRSGKRNVVASIAEWSADPDVKIFWFDPSDLRPGVPLDGISAIDANGHRL